MASANNAIKDLDTVMEAYEEVRADVTETNWFCLGYEDKEIVFKGKGESYEDLLQFFQEDERCYAYLRMKTGDDMSVRAKFVFITWIGPSVSPLKKAKVSTDKAFVKDCVKEFSKEILADELKDLNYEKIKEAVELASGAKY